MTAYSEDAVSENVVLLRFDQMRIDLLTNEGELASNLRQWCTEAGLRYTIAIARVPMAHTTIRHASIGHTFENQWLKHVYAAVFETVEDAVMFKMRCGGS